MSLKSYSNLIELKMEVIDENKLNLQIELNRLNTSHYAISTRMKKLSTHMKIIHHLFN